MTIRGKFSKLEKFGWKAVPDPTKHPTYNLESLSFFELESLENLVMQKLGKGWGSSTVEFEVAALNSLAKQFGIEIHGAMDVGANVGEWSMCFIKTFPGIRLYSFEPQAAAFIQLHESFQELNFEHVEAIRAAIVPHSTANVTLYKDNEASGLASTYQRRLGHFEIDFSLTESVPALTFLELAARIQPHETNVLKLDIEGAELGLIEVILHQNHFCFDLIQFEFGGCNIDSRTFFQDFWYLLQNSGYKVYRITPLGLYRLDRYLESYETFKTTNMIAVRSASA